MGQGDEGKGSSLRRDISEQLCTVSTHVCTPSPSSSLERGLGLKEELTHLYPSGRRLADGHIKEDNGTRYPSRRV